MNRISVIASSLMLGLLIFISCNDGQEKTKPTLSAVTESVYSSVTIQPDSLYQVFTVVAGLVDSCYVTEGELVRKGQPLLHIVNDRPELMKENAALSLHLARENLSGQSAVLKELEKELETAQLRLRNDSANYSRQKNLWDKGIGSQAEYDARKLSYEHSRNSYLALVKRYARTNKELETTLKQAENNYKSNLTTVQDYTVKSDIHGKVYSIFREQGELVSSQQPIATVGKADKFIIEMLVDEVDIVDVKVGQLALITLEAYGNKVFEARITHLYPSKNERTQTFKVEGEFIDPPETMYPGLSGEASIVINKKENTLTIPIDYLIDDHLVQTDDGPVEVTTGLRNLTTIEILSGLDTNTYIYKPAL